tara:strand:+ start:61 stop:480 length:420 start_codon:yes stop_codon:yes gene_type:complete
MSWVIVAMAVAATGTSLMQLEAGKAQEEEFERQAQEEKIAAEGRELQRKQELNRVLAANAVSASMSGITGEGTPASISLESAKQIGSSEAMINLSEKLKQAQLRRQGANAKFTSRIAAASTLLQSGSSIAGSGEFGGGD